MLRVDLQIRFDEHQQVALELQMVLTICVFGHPPTLQIHKISRGFTVVHSGGQQDPRREGKTDSFQVGI